MAFLLERTRAGTYRVEAFRNAVKTLKTLDAAELRERAEAGTLQEIPGIGKSTSGVITEALAGELPAYLASLQEKSGGPLVDGGEQMYARAARRLPPALRLERRRLPHRRDGADRHRARPRVARAHRPQPRSCGSPTA